MALTYLVKQSTISEFLTLIQREQVPEKVNLEYLKKQGYTSSNDRPIVPLLKMLDFIDSSGAPTGVYRQYRNTKEAPRVLARAIRKGYPDLFGTFHDAHRRDMEALTNYFRTVDDRGDSVISALAYTFRTLCGLADFGGVPEVEEEKEEPERGKEARRRKAAAVTVGEGPALSINIQLQLPATQDASIYDKLFASLRKHLISPPEEET